MSDFSKIVETLRIYLETDKLIGIDELFVNKGERGDRGEKGDRGTTGCCIGIEKERLLEELKNKAQACQACPLNKRRTNLVFGTGNPSARLMFVGEAPGADEDLQGEPFVGRAGALLTKMIEAINLKRQEVYIANVLKCRPPNNRSPLPAEIEACTHFLSEQIDIIKPKVICALGKFASQFLLKSEGPITVLRGKIFDLNGIKVMPTFHPAYLLRNPNAKKLVWEDLKQIRDVLKKR